MAMMPANLVPQELLQARGFRICAAHVVVGGLQISLAKRLLRLIQLVMQAVHGGDNIAAKIQTLGALLTADLVYAGQGGVGTGFKVGVPVVGISNFLRRRAGGLGGRRGSCG